VIGAHLVAVVVAVIGVVAVVVAVIGAHLVAVVRRGAVVALNQVGAHGCGAGGGEGCLPAGQVRTVPPALPERDRRGWPGAGR